MHACVQGHLDCCDVFDCKISTLHVCDAGIPPEGTLVILAAVEAQLTNPELIAELVQVRNALLLSTDGPDTVVTIA